MKSFIFWKIGIIPLLFVSVFGVQVESAQYGSLYEDSEDRSFDQSDSSRLKIDMPYYSDDLNLREAEYDEFSSRESMFVRHPESIQSAFKGKLTKPMISLAKVVKVENEEIDGKRIQRKSLVVQPIIQYVIHQYNKKKEGHERLPSLDQYNDANSLNSITMSEDEHYGDEDQGFGNQGFGSYSNSINDETKDNFGVSDIQGAIGGYSHTISSVGGERISGNYYNPHNQAFSTSNIDTSSTGIQQDISSTGSFQASPNIGNGGQSRDSSPTNGAAFNSGNQGSNGYSSLANLAFSNSRGQVSGGGYSGTDYTGSGGSTSNSRSVGSSDNTNQGEAGGYSTLPDETYGQNEYTSQDSSNSNSGVNNAQATGYPSVGSENGYTSSRRLHPNTSARQQAHSDPGIELSFEGYLNSGPPEEPDHNRSGARSKQPTLHGSPSMTLQRPTHRTQNSNNQARGNSRHSNAFDRVPSPFAPHDLIGGYGAPQTNSADASSGTSQTRPSNQNSQNHKQIDFKLGSQQISLSYGVEPGTSSQQQFQNQAGQYQHVSSNHDVQSDSRIPESTHQQGQGSQSQLNEGNGQTPADQQSELSTGTSITPVSGSGTATQAQSHNYIVGSSGSASQTVANQGEQGQWVKLKGYGRPRKRLRNPFVCLRCIGGLNAYFKVLVAAGIAPKQGSGKHSEFGPPKSQQEQPKRERKLSMKDEYPLQNFRRGLRRSMGLRHGYSRGGQYVSIG